MSDKLRAALLRLDRATDALIEEHLDVSDKLRELAPTFANTGVLTHHDLGCRCWPHVSEQDALDAIAAVGLAEYRDGRAALTDAPALDVAPGRWAFLDTETGDWIEVKPGVVYTRAVSKEVRG